MMKHIITVLAFTFFITGAQAQTFSEWFQQKKTQKKYLAEQIAALQVYIGFAQKGYKIGEDGLNLIGDIKDGDFSLHKAYFGSLSKVNPEIKKYGRVEDCYLLQEKIASLQRKTLRQLRESMLLTVGEIGYCEQVFGRLIERSDYTIADLTMVTEDDTFRLKDDERLQRIDRFYADMVDKYDFAVSFSNNALALVRNRYLHLDEFRQSRILNGIN